jgi:hypothetical protein
MNNVKVIHLTPEEEEEQRRSWAFGNVSLSNSTITRETVDSVANEMKTIDCG